MPSELFVLPSSPVPQRRHHHVGVVGGGDEDVHGPEGLPVGGEVLAADVRGLGRAAEQLEAHQGEESSVGLYRRKNVTRNYIDHLRRAVIRLLAKLSK